MQFPGPNLNVATSQNTIALDANVQLTVNAINANQVLPVGDFGGPNIYYFQTFENGLGSIVYTIFDKTTTLGLASFSVRFGAAQTIRDVLFGPIPRSQIDLQFLILPAFNIQSAPQGTVIP